MDVNEAIRILDIVKCDILGYARDLSWTPTAAQVGQAIQAVEDFLDR